MSTDREDARLQALISVLRAAAASDIDLDKLLAAAVSDAEMNSRDEFKAAIKNEIRIARAMATAPVGRRTI